MGQRSEFRESFDLALSRGVAKLRVLLEYTLPFCRLGGMFLALKHENIQQELADATNALDTLGGAYANILPVELSSFSDRRVLVRVLKETSTPSKFPRRPGLPSKHPL
jgi:16S rRNA (guanine527-N7)-methyltransferase